MTSIDTADNPASVNEPASRENPQTNADWLADTILVLVENL
jgi:hypothetical protein